jgi:hypothetical protein
MEIAAHLFLRISAPSALGFRAETGHTVSVDIRTGIPQQIQNLVKRYGIELLQIIYLPVISLLYWEVERSADKRGYCG